jgi:hypothetical protein
MKSYLARLRRLHLHPTQASFPWLNLIERWFRELSQRRLRRGVFHSVSEIVQAVQEYLDHNNQEPTPFVWTAKDHKILEKVQNCKAAFEKP